ncbi:MAG: hypothetical protein QGH51_06350 [Planctomycetota bacterium]|nr:hypothetical protein [Planctomycetota bacterium]
MLLAAITLSLLPQPQDAWHALTEKGLRIECMEKPAPGDLVIQTPFGSYLTATDPVKTSFRIPSGNWRERLEENPRFNLAEEVARLDSDGSLRELVELTNWLLKHRPNEDLVQAATALEKWGAGIDPLKPGTAMNKRPELLWKEVQKTKDAQAFLFAGLFIEEAQANSAGTSGQGSLTISEIKKALKSPSEIVRRTGALAAEKARIDEAELVGILMNGSIGGSLLTRDACARAAISCWENGTLTWWTSLLLRGEQGSRLSAGRNLALYGGERGLRGLLFLLSARGKEVGSSYTFDGRPIRIIKNSFRSKLLSASSLDFNSGNASITLLNFEDDLLDIGSTERITRVKTEIANKVLEFARASPALAPSTTVGNLLEKMFVAK